MKGYSSERQPERTKQQHQEGKKAQEQTRRLYLTPLKAWGETIVAQGLRWQVVKPLENETRHFFV